MSVCLRYVPDRAQAEDLFQESFFKVFTKLDQFNGQNLEAWMRTIFIREAINYYHRQYKKIYNQSDIEGFDAEGDEPNALLQMQANDLHQLIAGLPEGCRLVFNLYAVEGYDHKEIAGMLEISEGTSKSQLHRARKLLQEKLGVRHER